MPAASAVHRSGVLTSDEARTRLIDAAERLIALRTDEGASSRAIIAAAGQRHNSAITYHFGDRRALLDAVWQQRSAVVNRRRSELVEAWSGRRPGLRELVEAWIVPFAEFVGDGRPSYWARFNEDELRRYPLDILPRLRPNLDGRPQEKPMEVLVGVLEAIRDRLPPGPVRAIQVSTALRMVISTFAAWERDAEAGQQLLSATELGSSLVDSTLGLLHAPEGIRSTAR